MEIISKEVIVNKTLNNDDIEKELSKYGEPLRWAVVDITDNEFVVDGVFIIENK